MEKIRIQVCLEPYDYEFLTTWNYRAKQKNLSETIKDLISAYRTLARFKARLEMKAQEDRQTKVITDRGNEEIKEYQGAKND